MKSLHFKVFKTGYFKEKLMFSIQFHDDCNIDSEIKGCLVEGQPLILYNMCIFCAYETFSNDTLIPYFKLQSNYFH